MIHSDLQGQKYSLVFLGVVFETLLKKAYEQLRQRISKNSPSMIKGIAVETDRLNGRHHLSLTLNDVRGMTEKNYENLAGIKRLLYFCHDKTLRHTV